MVFTSKSITHEDTKDTKNRKMNVSLRGDKAEQYQAWIRRENGERPLVGVLWEPDIPPLPEMLERTGLGNEITPEDIDPALFLPFIEQCYEEEQRLDSDVIQPFCPSFGIPWMEAIAGCTLVAEEGSIWAEHWLADYASCPTFTFDPRNPWLVRLVEFTRALVECSAGRFPVALPQMRGPLDILSAIRTPAQMCLDLLEQPEAVQSVLDELTGLWIEVARSLLEVIPPFHGGWSSRMKMWAPGPTITPQNDASSLISPKTYAAALFESDRRIFSSFPYSCFHMHSTEWRHVDTLLHQPDLTAIEFTLEHQMGGLALEPSVEVARKILAHKPLVLAAPDPEIGRVLPPAPACQRVVPAGLLQRAQPSCGAPALGRRNRRI